jgi:hypothetical protein
MVRAAATSYRPSAATAKTVMWYRHKTNNRQITDKEQTNRSVAMFLLSDSTRQMGAMATDLDEFTFASRSAAAAPSQSLDQAFFADSITARQQRAFKDLRHRRRSVARRVKERLILGVATLVLFGATVWTIPNESPVTTSSPPVHRVEKSQDRIASAEPTLAIQSRPMMPIWLLGILDVPPPAVSPFGARRAQ